MAELRWGAATHPGMVRSDNEDTFVAEPMVFAVADGMGGHQAGEVASALAASILRDRLGAGAASEDAAAGVVAEANAAIYGAAKANSAQSGMGTTLTAIAVLTDSDEERLVLLNVGDSRTYRLRNGRLQRVTVDHSYVQELVASGHITQEEARTHPRRNIVTRALGIEPVVRADMWTMPLVRGDRFVLASDGLVDEVADPDILELVISVSDPQSLSEQLVAMANQHGGRDNVTVVVVDVVEGADPPDPTEDIEIDPSWAEAGDSGIWAEDGLAPPTAGAPMFDAPVPDAVPAAASGSDDTPASPPPITSPIPMIAPPPPQEPMEDLDGDGVPDAPAMTDGGATVASPAVAEPVLAAPGAAAAMPSLPGGPLQIDESVRVAATPMTDKPKRRFTGGVFLFVFIVAAILTVTFTLIAVHARSGYFVGFNGDTVVVFKGQRDNVLWFEPTVNSPGDIKRDMLTPTDVDAVEARPEFETSTEAAEFITTLIAHSTAATSTTTTTTTVVTSTTIGTTSTTSTGTTTTVSQGP